MPPEDGGEDLRGAREAAGLGGGEVVAGDEAGADEVGGGKVCLECGEGDGDDDGGGVTAVDREPLGVDGFEELAQCLTEPLGVGQPGEGVAFWGGGVVAGWLAGVGVGLEVGREPGGGVVGDETGDAGGAVAEAAHAQPGGVGRMGFEGGEAGGFGCFGDLGSDDVEDPAPDPAELLGSELGSPGDQVDLRRGDGVGVDRAGERVEGAVDDVGLRQCRLALAHRRSQDRVVPIQDSGQPQVGAGVGVPGAGLLCQPPGGVLRGRVLREVTCVGEDPQPELGQLPLGTDQLGECGGLVVGRHERRVRPRDALEQGADVGDGGNDRMRHGCICHCWPPLDDGSRHAHA